MTRDMDGHEYVSPEGSLTMVEREARRLHAEVEQLRAESAFKSVELHKRDAAIHRLCGELHQHDRVIARLLDGWRPVVDPADEPGLWVGTAYYMEDAPEEWMSDGEAAIIRAHQEKR